MAAPTPATTADLERAKREMNQAIQRLEQRLTRVESSVQSASTAGLTRRLDQTDGVVQTLSNNWAEMRTRVDRLTRRIDTFERLETRLAAVEQRAQTIVDSTNRSLTHAHTFDERLSSRVDALERRVTELGRSR